MTKQELEEQLRQLFTDEQRLGINEQDRFHNSEDGIWVVFPPFPKINSQIKY